MTPGDPTAQLERLPGVVAATLFLDTPASPRVYLATATDADHETLRATVVGLLHDHGYSTPPERIHIGTAPPRRAGRPGIVPPLTLDALDIQRSDFRVTCTVRLRVAGRTSTGEATEPDTASGRARSAARAALEAVEGLDPDFRFGLEGVRTTDIFGQEAVLLLVDASAGRLHAHLPGTALVQQSVEESAALAALNALRGWSG